MKRIGRIPELTTKAKVFAGIAAFVVLGGIGTLVATTFITQQLQSGNDIPDFKNMDADTRKRDAVKSAQSAANSGDSSKGSSIYEQAIQDEPDPAKKVELAINQSRMLNHAGKFDEAVEVAKKAEAYNEDKFAITDWLAQLHERGKRYEEAAEYYERAGTMADSPTNVGQYSKKFYAREAARVRGLAK